MLSRLKAPAMLQNSRRGIDDHVSLTKVSPQLCGLTWRGVGSDKSICPGEIQLLSEKPRSFNIHVWSELVHREAA